MRPSLCRNTTANQSALFDSKMQKFFQGVARKKDTGVTSDDMVVAMRRQNPYNFVGKDAQNLVHSALGTDGVDFNRFYNFAARVITENVENYLNEFMEALQVGNEGCLTRYRLEMLFCQEIGANVDHVQEAFKSLTDDSVITIETLWGMLEGQRHLLGCLVRHIFRKELSLQSGDEVSDRLTAATAEKLTKKNARVCCSVM